VSPMAKASCRIPDDWWGLGVGNVTRIVKQCGARVSNLTFEYDPIHDQYRITGIGTYRIIATSEKQLRHVKNAIRQAVQAANVDSKELDRIAVESMRLWRQEARERRKEKGRQPHKKRRQGNRLL
jgi:hypothetical protein